MGTLVKATDTKGSQTLGTNASAKQMEVNSALARMLHKSVCHCNAICILETDSLEGEGKCEGVRLKLPLISSPFQH